MSVFRVPPEGAGQRLDVFLCNELRRTSRTRTQQIIKASAFDPSGRRLRASDRVLPFQEVVLWRPPWDETPVPTDISILYEDDHLLAVDKPPHLPVHPTARYYRNTLIKVVQALRPGLPLSLGHRLDRETSGVMLLTKTPQCDRALKRQFELRDGVEKRYIALTWGVPRELETAGRLRFELSVELDVESGYRVKMRPGKGAAAQFAATWFELEEARTSSDGRCYGRVRCDLETGRQHQIRVHLAALGAPIVGDKLYGPDESCFARGADNTLTDADRNLLELPRHALHAARLALPHPITASPLEIVAPLPGDLTAFWTALGGGGGDVSRSAGAEPT